MIDLRSFDKAPSCDQVGLGHLAQRKVSEIAYGEKRRVEIAIALSQKPKLLLLDEPLAGLSTEERGVHAEAVDRRHSPRDDHHHDRA